MLPSFLRADSRTSVLIERKFWMAIRKILLLGNPTLRIHCASVKDPSSAVTQKTIRDLRDTLNDFRLRRGFGRGIAAPQIGSTTRIIFIRSKGIGALVNPKITLRSLRVFSLWDDCFSFPDILVKVRRNAWVEVSYIDEHGKRKRLRAEGPLSELLQHEIDHLDGVLAIDRAISPKHIILRSQRGKLP